VPLTCSYRTYSKGWCWSLLRLDFYWLHPWWWHCCLS
jgi:hypothetical protein